MDNNKDFKHSYIVNREKNYIQENQNYPSRLIFGKSNSKDNVGFEYEIVIVDNEAIFDYETDT